MIAYYIYKMTILPNDLYEGIYIGQHKIGSKDPSCDNYKGSGSDWKKYILKNKIPVKKEILRLCNNLEESNYWEKYYIDQAKQNGEHLWNILEGGRNHDPWRKYTKEELREKNKIRCKEWYLENKERNCENGRRNRKLHKEQYAETRRAYEERNKDRIKAYHKNYYEQNKERHSLKAKEYYEKHKERILEKSREYNKIYAETHKEVLRDKARKYNDSHKEEHKKYKSQLCCYEGKEMTLNALSLKFLRKGIDNPTQKAKEYLIEN